MKAKVMQDKKRYCSWYSQRIGCQISFRCAGEGHYIFLNIDGTWRQPCYGGDLMGTTMDWRGGSEERFEALCREWWSTFLRRNGDATKVFLYRPDLRYSHSKSFRKYSLPTFLWAVAHGRIALPSPNPNDDDWEEENGLFE